MARDPGAVEAHLWCVELDRDADLARLSSALTEDERARAARFAYARDRRQYVAARAALRSILSSWVGIPPQDLELVYGAHGKPALAPWCSAADLRFNVSHSRGLALVGLVHGHDIGVDVEAPRRLDDVDALVAREFSAGERGRFASLAPEDRHDAFLRAWVAKEAFVKATGEGLHRSLAGVEVSFAPREPARLLAVEGDTSASQRWALISLSPRPGYVGALVAQVPSLRVVHHEFGRTPVAYL